MTRFSQLRVAEVKRETPDAYRKRFELPESLREAFAFKAGQHLTFRREIGGEEIRRNYSVCVSPSEGVLKIGVKKIAGGAFSGWVNDELKAGDAVEVMAPHGSFCWDFEPGAQREYVGFAGGSGVTPVLSLLKAALELEPKSRLPSYGNRVSAGIMFLEEIAALKDRYIDRLSVFHFLEDEEEEIALFNGRLDRAKIDEALAKLAPAADVYFICGPGPMMDAAEAALIARGWPASKSSASPPGRLAAQAAARAMEEKAAGLKMSVTLNGRRANVTDPRTRRSSTTRAAVAGALRARAVRGPAAP